MRLLLSNLREKKYLVQFIIYLGLFFVLFFLLDFLNASYNEIITNYGLYLVIINIIINIIMGLISALLMISSELIIRGYKGSNLSFIAIIFGMFTYGCAPCLIAFFSNIGIMISVVVLPFAGLPYKLISLGLILIGFFITIKQYKKGCRINLKQEKNK